jgi:hypothetical protein
MGQKYTSKIDQSHHKNSEHYQSGFIGIGWCEGQFYQKLGFILCGVVILSAGSFWPNFESAGGKYACVVVANASCDRCNGNASCDRCEPEMTRVVITPPTSSSLRSLHHGLDRQCIHVRSSAQERRLIIPMHVLCSSSSTSSSPQARVSSRQDDSSSSPFMLLNVSYSSLGESTVWASWPTTNGSHLCPVRVSYYLSSQRGSEAEAQKQKDTVNFFCHASICLSKLLAMWIKRV